MRCCRTAAQACSAAHPPTLPQQPLRPTPCCFPFPFSSAIDTGWISEENPAARAARTAATHNFQTPIDEIDAAARILDPIFAPLLEAGATADGCCRVPYGAFLKDYFMSEW